MDNKPKMYRCDTKKEFNNNRIVFTKYDNDIKEYDTLNIRDKINNIFMSSSFIYRIKVNIVMNNQVYNKKIIGMYNDNLVTIDNEHIPINLIQDIYI